MLLVAPLALLVWALAAFAYLGSHGGNARAEGTTQFRDEHLSLAVFDESEGLWYRLEIEFFLKDDGQGDFAAEAEAAKQEMLARFPGAIELDHAEATAAFALSGFSWVQGSASWTYDNVGAPISGAQGAIGGGAGQWGQVGADFQFSGGGSSSDGTGACAGSSGRDQKNTVGWGAQSGSVLAVTCSWFGGSNAKEFDMEFDPDWDWTTGSTGIGVDLHSVATHEFGHALGLDHTNIPGAVMFPSYTSGTLNRVPQADDIAGAIAIYGASVPGPTNTPASTNTPTNTPTNTSTMTPTPTLTPANTSTRTPTPTLTPTNTPTLFPSQSPTATFTPNAPPSPTATTPSNTPTNTPPSTATMTSTPKPSPSASTTPGASLPLLPGANLLAWPGSNMATGQAIGSASNQVITVYGWEPSTKTWKRYGPGLPSFVNTLGTLQQGQAYWFIASGSSQIPFTP